MIMLTLIQTKQPVKDADKIRALACQALVGLARSTTATQVGRQIDRWIDSWIYIWLEIQIDKQIYIQMYGWKDI